MAMRIALVNKVFSQRHGGGERYALTLARGLLDRGQEVHLFGHIVEDPPRGAQVTKVAMPRWPASARVLGFASRARKLIDAQSFDVVYGLTQVYPVDLYFMGGGTIHHWLRSRFASPLLRYGKYVRNPVNLAHCWLERRIFDGSNHRYIVANSKLIQQHAMQYHGVSADRVAVIYHGVDHERFSPSVRDAHRSAVRQELGYGPGEVVALLASHNWGRKGLATLLRAVAAMGDAGRAYRVLAVGKSRHGPMRRLAEELGLADRVTLLPPSGAIERYLGAADVFVLPTRYDPFAAVTLEALACGLPVVTSSENGGAEAVSHGGSGYVLEDPQDADGLARYLAELLDGGRREAMSEQAVADAAEFTWSRHFEQTLALCERVLSEKRGVRERE